MALLPSIKKFYYNQCFGGLGPSRRPHAVYDIAPHLRLKGVSPVNELGAERLFGFSRKNKHCQLFGCSGMLLAGCEIGKSEGIEHLEWPPVTA